MKSFREIFAEAEERPAYHASVRRLELLERIEQRPQCLGGKPCVRGTGLSVEYILGCLVFGVAPEQLVEDFPSLEPEDILACFAHALEAVEREWHEKERG